ncbi:tRNA pseudouridine synthase B [Plenodomus tracheiphilus IPT5]|uniref:tRNA pseudouridine(55) synthase n=1 Tax=Plenodomus tracheiphilus IPT5 TaxID=1408161 RepID=A0A6A7B850_9PLEO|nr:tRNA pseudouridine synthase B [Plenodomus tracheiphilus IPT5]
MEQEEEPVLEGIFAVAKPANISSADVLDKLQTCFAPSQTFARLLQSQPRRPSKSNDQVFKLGHGGTLDPLAAGVLIVGIGRGTKHLQQYLACKKTYETVVLFGASTDTYDCTGQVTDRVAFDHIVKEAVESQLAHFKGTIQQTPPLYSALKVNGRKACDYARQGEELPRQLESREMYVDECKLLDWYPPGQHKYPWPGEDSPAPAPAVRVLLTVSSGFYVRSFAHDLGIACQSRSHMTALVRTQQANFALKNSDESEGLTDTITYEDLDAGEDVWGLILRRQLQTWCLANPERKGHVNGREQSTKIKIAHEKERRPKQRFRGGWMAETKAERVQQQGGRYKGKWGTKLADGMSIGRTTDGIHGEKRSGEPGVPEPKYPGCT